MGKYWNALIATAETTNKLSLWMKMALFANLRYSTGRGIDTCAGAIQS